LELGQFECFSQRTPPPVGGMKPKLTPLLAKFSFLPRPELLQNFIAVIYYSSPKRTDMKLRAIITASSIAAILFTSCNNDDKKTINEIKEPALKEQIVSYKVDSSSMNSFVVYDSNITGKRPAVLVIHEWWGLNDYVKMRARELAKLGYIAMAVDVFGDGKMGNDPGEAEKLAMPFYMNPPLIRPRFDAAWNKLKEFSETDQSKAAAIGYCFGGAQVLNLARFGEDLKGVVSFHGNLTVTTPDKNLLKANILVCYGDDDKFVPPAELDLFKRQMDSVGAKYTVKVYPGASHSFTNPNATAIGQQFNLPISYNAAADSASWKDMREFFNTIFK
jgi:dienelactone hydrolase